MGHLEHFPQSPFDIVSPDGKVRASARGVFDKNGVITENILIEIEVGDEVRRVLPVGKEEVFEVVDWQYNEEFHGIDANFNIKLRRKGTMAPRTGGHYVHVSGDNARVNLNSSDYSSNQVTIQTATMPRLADELAILRAGLVTKASSAEEYAAVGQVASAEISARAGDTSGVGTALASLGKSGKWVFDLAKEIGVSLAKEEIRKKFGFP